MLLARLRSADWITAGTPQEKAKMDVDTIYRDRAACVKRYLELNVCFFEQIILLLLFYRFELCPIDVFTKGRLKAGASELV